LGLAEIKVALFRWASEKGETLGMGAFDRKRKINGPDRGVPLDTPRLRRIKRWFEESFYESREEKYCPGGKAQRKIKGVKNRTVSAALRKTA